MNRLSSTPHPPLVTSLLASTFSALLAPVQNLQLKHVNRPQINTLDIHALFSLHLHCTTECGQERMTSLRLQNFFNPTLHYFSETFYRQWWLKALVKGIPDLKTTQTPQVKEDLFPNHSLACCYCSIHKLWVFQWIMPSSMTAADQFSSTFT